MRITLNLDNDLLGEAQRPTETGTSS